LRRAFLVSVPFLPTFPNYPLHSFFSRGPSDCPLCAPFRTTQRMKFFCIFLSFGICKGLCRLVGDLFCLAHLRSLYVSECPLYFFFPPQSLPVRTRRFLPRTFKPPGLSFLAWTPINLIRPLCYHIGVELSFPPPPDRIYHRSPLDFLASPHAYPPVFNDLFPNCPSLRTLSLALITL